MLARKHATPHAVVGTPVLPFLAVAALAATGAFGASVIYSVHELERVDRSLPDLVQRDVSASAHLTVLRTDLHLALGLDGACLAVAFACGALAIVAVRREHARLRAQLEELEVFADRVAHDIRGPLMPVAFALEEAKRHATEPNRTFLERGARSIRVVEGIVDGLHAFARSQLPPPASAKADVRSVVEDVVSESQSEAEQASVDLSVLALADVQVRCEPGVLSSIVSNLVHNAVRHMGRSPVRRVTVSAHLHARLVAVVVQDTGPGLPPGFETRAFLPYVRADSTRRQGLGLGLATVKRLAIAHGGSVSVTSNAKGCTFVVDLPVCEAHSATSSPAEFAHGG